MNGFLWADFMSFSSAISYTFIIWTELVPNLSNKTWRWRRRHQQREMFNERRRHRNVEREKKCSVTKTRLRARKENKERILNEAEWLWSEITSILCDFMKMNFGPQSRPKQQQNTTVALPSLSTYDDTVKRTYSHELQWATESASPFFLPYDVFVN